MPQPPSCKCRTRRFVGEDGIRRTDVSTVSCEIHGKAKLDESGFPVTELPDARDDGDGPSKPSERMG